MVLNKLLPKGTGRHRGAGKSDPNRNVQVYIKDPRGRLYETSLWILHRIAIFEDRD